MRARLFCAHAVCKIDLIALGRSMSELIHDVFTVIAAHASLGTVNALLRSCHALSRMRVKPARISRPMRALPNIAGCVNALSNGVRDGVSSYSRGHSTISIVYKRGQITRWSADYVSVSIVKGGEPTIEHSRLCGVADSRAWLCVPCDVTGRYIMRWAVTRRLAIDACPLTGSIWLSDALTQRKKRRSDIVATHRVFDERNRIDIAGLTAWMADVAAIIEPSINVPAAHASPWTSLRRTVRVILRVSLDTITSL